MTATFCIYLAAEGIDMRTLCADMANPCSALPRMHNEPNDEHLAKRSLDLCVLTVD